MTLILKLQGKPRQIQKALAFLCKKAGNRTLGELATKESK